ncbi:MAG: phosphohistidine phosphatase SixA [Chloroflexi bacterium]|nr:phosphohistidine phosphatase SixA [Chloroflexota bacterium]
MRYYFVRHGIAEDMAESDFSRELTGRGRRRVATSAAVMKRLNLRPARIYSSPRLRARQTAEIIGDTLDLPVSLADEVNFGFDLSDINSLTRNMRIDDEVMFVGHNPDMSLLVHELTGVDVSMKKGGLARVDLFGRNAQHGELVWLIAPKVFDAMNEASAQGSPAELFALTPPQKLAQSDYPLHALIRHRWSPVGFDQRRGIDRSTLLSILEAARWAASSSNLQPWRFIVALKEDRAEFEKLLSALAEGNQTWARHAAVLMVAVTHKYRKPDVINRHAGHDLGQAIAQMVIQALHHDIYVHQMGGFFPEKARELYHIPDEFEPFTAIAMGYRTAELEHLANRHQQREAAQRVRQDLSEMVFNSAWGRAADFLE